jgi:hypothetical protein
MQYLKSTINVLVLLAVFLPVTINAFGFNQPLGSPGNPIHGTMQIIETDSQKEDKLINALGYREYLSCRSSVCGSGDMSNPTSRSNCYMQIEYAVARGVCARPRPQQTCDVGFSRVNNSCVRDEAPAPFTCPRGSYILRSPEGLECVGIIEQHPDSMLNANQSPSDEESICREDYGSHSVWTGERNSNGGVVCSCANGYDFIDNSDTCKLVPETQGVSTDELQARSIPQSIRTLS